jgi:hypothetical protein
MKKPCITLLVLIASFLVPLIVLGENPPHAVVRSPNGSKFVASGQLLRVCSVVYADFSAELKERSRQATSDVQKYLSNIGSYELEVSDSADVYTTVLGVRPLKCDT